jgi:acyl-CoA thioesterase-1
MIAPTTGHAYGRNFPPWRYAARPLPNLARSLKQRNTKIVAFGSSATSGMLSVVPYPARLELMLRYAVQANDGFGKRIINVINRGVGGEEATTEMLRIQSDVIAEAPALVIWQVGTNAVFRSNEFDFEAVVKAIADGLTLLSRIPTDVVLMDSQYSTAVVTDEKRPLCEKMVKRLSELAEDAGVDVFRRWALMPPWHIAMRELVDPADGLQLHLSEGATQNVTEARFGQIKTAVNAAGVT